MKLDKILVPTDFSASGELASELAVELALATGASLTFLHVYDPMPYAFPPGTAFSSIVNADDALAGFRKLLEEYRRRAERAGAARVETLLLEGTAYMEIARIAEQQDYKLIVTGTDGRTGLDRMLLGSVAEKVVRKARCPVLTVPLRNMQVASALRT
jgi:nucleotide-binding universal stress UspA family protein